MVRDEAGKKGEGYMMEAFPELYSMPVISAGV